MHKLHLRRIRLVAFHNIDHLDIEVGGHLFLIGENESGKTTVLDALHLVLSGEQDLDWNAAARLAGARDEGRSLAGVVLCADRWGKARRSSGVTWVVLELGAEPGYKPVTLVFGAHAQSMDSRAERWGAIGSWTATELPLLEEGPEGARVRDLAEVEQLAESGHRNVGRYRSAVAEALFGAREHFDRITELWRLAKSYRELAKAAKDSGDLVRKMLRAPDPEPFLRLRKAFRDLREISASLADLEGEVADLRRLQDLLAEARTARETLLRYRYVEAYHEHVSAQQVHVSAVDRLRAQLEGARRKRAAGALAEAKRAGLDAQLRVLRAREAFGIAEALRRQERQVEDAARGLASLQRKVDQGTEAVRLALAGEAGRRDVARRMRASISGQLGAWLDQFLVPTHLDARPVLDAASVARRLLTDEIELSTFQENGFTACASSLRHALAPLAEAAIQLKDTASKRIQEIEPVKAALDAERGELELHAEVLPDIPGYAALLRELAEAGTPAAPLYRFVEFAEGTEPAVAAAVESFIGVRTLASLVVPPAHVPSVRERVLARGDGILVLDASPAPTENHPPSLSAGEQVGACLRVEDARVRAHLLARLGGAAVVDEQPEDGVGPAWVISDGTRGGSAARGRQVPEAPQFIGAETRTRALAARVAEIERLLQPLASELERKNEELRDAEAVLGQLTKMGDAVQGIGEKLPARVRDWASAAELARTQGAHLAELQALHESARAAEELARSELQALQLKAEASDAEAVARQVEALDGELTTALQEATRLVADAESLEKEAVNISSSLPEKEGRVVAAARVLEDANNTLSVLLDAQHSANVHRYVFEARQGSRIHPGNVRDRIDEATREESTLVERLRGSDGMLANKLAQRHGFRMVADRLEVVDRQGVSLADLVVSREEERQKWSHQLDSRTRELVDQVLAQDLVERIRDDVQGLHELVRGLNKVFKRFKFGHSRYEVHHKAEKDYRDLLELIERQALLDAASRDRLRDYLTSRQDTLADMTDGTVPEFLDYRNWFGFSLALSGAGPDEARGLDFGDLLRGSGGTQGVQNYLLLFALATMVFDACEARLRVLFMDEAFYGLDRRRQRGLLRIAQELGLDLVIATPDLDGTAMDGHDSTTVLLERTEEDEVRVSRFLWERSPGLFNREPEAWIGQRADSEPE